MKLMEPIMVVKIVTPAEHLIAVIDDLMLRRSVVKPTRRNGAGRLIEAHVPLSLMFGCIKTLNSITRGQATYTMRFSHYAAVPIDWRGPDDDPPMAVRA